MPKCACCVVLCTFLHRLPLGKPRSAGHLVEFLIFNEYPEKRKKNSYV